MWWKRKGLEKGRWGRKKERGEREESSCACDHSVAPTMNERHERGKKKEERRGEKAK